jgi:hypothetical protein
MKDNMLEAYAELCFNMLKDICARAYAMFFSALFFFWFGDHWLCIANMARTGYFGYMKINV